MIFIALPFPRAVEIVEKYYIRMNGALSNFVGSNELI